MCAVLGLSFTACDPRRLPDPDAMGAPDVDALDALVGHWRSIEVTKFDGITYTRDLGMTIEADLTGAVAASIHYDAPGTMYDEDYDYMLTLTAVAVGSAKYRIDFRDPTESPERPGSIMTCTLTGTALACDPDDEFLDNENFERED